MGQSRSPRPKSSAYGTKLRTVTLSAVGQGANVRNSSSEHCRGSSGERFWGDTLHNAEHGATGVSLISVKLGPKRYALRNEFEG
jgi:hypothetical protein